MYKELWGMFPADMLVKRFLEVNVWNRYIRTSAIFYLGIAWACEYLHDIAENAKWKYEEHV